MGPKNFTRMGAAYFIYLLSFCMPAARASVTFLKKSNQKTLLASGLLFLYLPTVICSTTLPKKHYPLINPPKNNRKVVLIKQSSLRSFLSRKRPKIKTHRGCGVFFMFNIHFLCSSYTRLTSFISTSISSFFRGSRKRSEG